MLDDLLADLLWPKLFRAPVMALNPGRIALAAFFVLIAVVTLSILRAIEQGFGWGSSEESVQRLRWTTTIVFSIPDLESPRTWATAWIDSLMAFPGAAIRAHPLVGTLGSLIVLFLIAISGGALSRSCVCELGGNIRCGWPDAVGFSLSRASSLVGALIGPILFVTILAFLISIGGLVLLRIPGVNLIGSVLFGLALICGFVAVIVILLYALGHVMLLPAVAADGSDAVDAIQRAYSYILGKPGRYVVYSLIAIVQGFIVVGIAVAVLAATVTFTLRASSQWAGEDARTMLTQAQAAATQGSNAEARVLREAAIRQATEMGEPAPTEPNATPDRFITFGWGARVIELWLLLPGLCVAGFVMSYVHAAGSTVYLIMRRLNDGQDFAEIWRPRERGERMAPAADAASSQASEAIGDAD